MNKIIKIVTFPIKMLEYGLIYFYKVCISPFFPKACRYVPSCSTYALGAIKEFGIFKGVVLSFKRLLRCNNKHCGGFDPVPSNIKGDIKWLI